MVMQPAPTQRYRLHDGSIGTEYEALSEALKTLQTRRQELDDRIEELQRRLETAEGHP